MAISKKELMEKFPKVENTMGAIEEVIDAVLADEFVPDTAVYIAITTLASKMDPKIPIEFYIDAIKECYSAKGWRVDYAGEVLIFI